MTYFSAEKIENFWKQQTADSTLVRNASYLLKALQEN